MSMSHKEGTEWPIEKEGRFEQSSCVKTLVKNWVFEFKYHNLRFRTHFMN